MNNIKAVRVTATGAAYAGRARITGVNVLHDAVGAGRLTFTDGSGGGTVLDLDFEAAAGSAQFSFDQLGILCETGIWVSTETNITAVTIFYTG